MPDSHEYTHIYIYREKDYRTSSKYIQNYYRGLVFNTITKIIDQTFNIDIKITDQGKYRLTQGANI